MRHFRKQTELGREVGCEIGVIVEMVAGDVGESDRRDVDAVETILIETVARRLQRQMVDAVFRHLRQKTMRFDGVRRRVRERMHAVLRHHADRAHAGGLEARRIPDLAQEHGDGRLAVGAGDGRDRPGLRAEKLRRHARQPRAGICVGDEAHAKRFRVALHLRLAEHGDGAALHGVADELRPIRARAGQARQRDSRA